MNIFTDVWLAIFKRELGSKRNHSGRFTFVLIKPQKPHADAAWNLHLSAVEVQLSVILIYFEKSCRATFLMCSDEPLASGVEADVARDFAFYGDVLHQLELTGGRIAGEDGDGVVRAV